MYSPFDKDIDQLELSDLQKLIDEKISENWFIEYKSRIPITGNSLDGIKIAKSVSSFANTKGGWIFWGIECSGNEPTAIIGVDLSGYERFQDDVSRVITSNINPVPVFHFKEIKLEGNTIVFIILVEESPIPPYVTNQGIIYQRENNESKPIRDRYIIEKMNEKAQQYNASIEDFSQFELGETKGEADSNLSQLELFLFPKPFGYENFKDFHKTSFFEMVSECFFNGNEFSFELGEEKKVIRITMGFNSIYTTNDSIVIRAINSKNMIFKTPTIELFRNGNLKATVPIFDFGPKNIPDHYENSLVLKYLLDKHFPEGDVPQYGRNYLSRIDPNLPPIRQRVENDFSRHIRFIDGGSLVLSIMMIVTIYEKILQDGGFNMSIPLGMRTRITNVWRKFVFFEGKDYLDKIKRYNIPLIPKSELEIPAFKNGSNYEFRFDEGSLAFLISTFILHGIGIPDPEGISYKELIKSAVSKFEGSYNETELDEFDDITSIED